MIPSDAKEEAAVKATMEAYSDAVFRGDADAVAQIFQPGAVMSGYLGDQFLVGGPEPFIDDIRSHPVMAETGAPFKYELSAIHASARTATATLHETGFFGSGEFVNYFHLVKVDGEWKIVSKTFETL